MIIQKLFHKGHETIRTQHKATDPGSYTEGNLEIETKGNNNHKVKRGTGRALCPLVDSFFKLLNQTKKTHNPN